MEALNFERAPTGSSPSFKGEDASEPTAQGAQGLALEFPEPGLAGREPGFRCQFMRHGYFCVDTKDTTADKTVWNRTVTLKDSWAKLESRGKTG